jgi:AcrR family transcriptional regulator
MAGPEGLRERKKAATRQALHEAAVRLAAEHGVENLTVEAIADAATVSRRTFSNYFASKEQALLHSDRVRLVRLLELVRARPAGEPPWAALTGAAEQFVAEAQPLDPRRVAHLRLVRRHPSLLAEQVATYAAIERELVEEISRRLPADPARPLARPLRARLLCGLLMTTLRVATQLWFELDQPRTSIPQASLAELLRGALAVIDRDVC